MLREHEMQHQPLFWRKGATPGAGQLPMSARLWRELRLAAQFGAYAARSNDQQALFDETCRIAAEGLGATFAKLLVYQPEERAFLLQAGVGWRDGVVGQTWFDADMSTAAGFAWQSGRAVVSNDLLAEDRFRVPDLLIEYGIVRSINVVVPGDGWAPFGVLEVESPNAGEFAAHDAHFLQLVAHSLAAAIAQGARQAVHEAQAAQGAVDYQVSLREMRHRVRNDLQGILSSISREMRDTADPAQREGFARVSRRVLALAALHDHPFGARADGSVDMAAYLRCLCDKIADATGLASRAIGLRIDTQPLAMTLDRAVRLAITVNELISNAAEHAFPDGRPGTITIRLLANGEDGTSCPVLTVTDDGRGFDGPRVGSDDLNFVKRLTRQAGGELSRGGAAGTGWRITLVA